MKEIETAILKTLCYRDLFGYPLTEDELRSFLIEKSASFQELGQVLDQLVAEKRVGKTGEFFHLKGREQIVKDRQLKEEISGRKWGKALRLAKLLRPFPWVRAVFLTGALAAGNAEEDADLDFLVITRESRVWLTRFFSYILFTLLGAKRRRGEAAAPDRVCLNMFLAETALTVPEESQNLFTAHEVALARPIWARDYLHRRFLGDNPWVKKFLPNLNFPENKTSAPRAGALPHRVLNLLMTVADGLLWRAQLIYMAPHRTRETVERQRILFHPIDLSRKFLSAYRVKVYSEQHRNPALRR